MLLGVGGDVRTALRETARGAELGAAGVMVHHPSHPYLCENGLIQYYTAIASATGGAVVPYVRGTGLSTAVLDHLASLGNVVGVKWAVPDALAFEVVASRYGSTLVPICGLAEYWAPFFWLSGAQGFTSGLVNVVPKLSRAMLDALRVNDYARAMELWRTVEPFERLRSRNANGNNVPTVKEALEALGLMSGAVRPPLAALGRSDRAELDRILPTLRAWL